MANILPLQPFAPFVLDNQQLTKEAYDFLYSMYNRVGGSTSKLNITGSRGGNVALANLLTALASIGLIIDSTIP